MKIKTAGVPILTSDKTNIKSKWQEIKVIIL
jgi:hypothetical protein